MKHLGICRERDVTFLKKQAKLVRMEILKMLALAGSGHTGGSLSAADIVTVLYFSKMRYRPDEPNWKERDRFILSKGHAAPLLYAVLAMTGYFNISMLKTLRKLGSPLQGHPCSRVLPGVEISTGSLGQGLSVSNVKGIEPVAAKWSAFGWHVIEIDGHSMEEILNGLDEAEKVKEKPTMIIAHTIKGKGVSFFEGKVEYHGMAPTHEELEKALKELGKSG